MYVVGLVNLELNVCVGNGPLGLVNDLNNKDLENIAVRERIIDKTIWRKAMQCIIGHVILWTLFS